MPSRLSEFRSLSSRTAFKNPSPTPPTSLPLLSSLLLLTSSLPAFLPPPHYFLSFHISFSYSFLLPQFFSLPIFVFSFSLLHRSFPPLYFLPFLPHSTFTSFPHISLHSPSPMRLPMFVCPPSLSPSTPERNITKAGTMVTENISFFAGGEGRREGGASYSNSQMHKILNLFRIFFFRVFPFPSFPIGLPFSFPTSS